MTRRVPFTTLITATPNAHRRGVCAHAHARTHAPAHRAAELPYYCPECPSSECPNSSATGPANGHFNCLPGLADPPGEYTLCPTDTAANETRFECVGTFVGEALP